MNSKGSYTYWQELKIIIELRSNLHRQMKSLYIVDYWVPFPSSEYGGVINLIAENDTEAFTILSQEQTYDDEYNHLIMQNVINAQKFVLQDDYESGIIDSFTT